MDHQRRAFLAGIPVAGATGLASGMAMTPQGLAIPNLLGRGPEASPCPCGVCILDFIPRQFHDDIRLGLHTDPLDTSFDDAIAAVSDTHGWPGAIYIPSGVYPISRPIVCPYVSLVGESRRSTILDGSLLPDDGEIVLQWAPTDGSAILSGARIERLTLRGNGRQLVGVECRGMSGILISNCRFVSLQAGVQFHNQVTGDFTEICVAEHCDFDLSCDRAIRYRVTGGGNDSFHGSGLHHCTVNTRGLCISIEPGAYVYNAPLFVTVWTHEQQNPIILNESGTASFYGHLGVEIFSPGATGAAIGAVRLLGTVQVQKAPAATWLDGTLSQCTHLVNDFC